MAPAAPASAAPVAIPLEAPAAPKVPQLAQPALVPPPAASVPAAAPEVQAPVSEPPATVAAPDTATAQPDLEALRSAALAQRATATLAAAAAAESEPAAAAAREPPASATPSVSTADTASAAALPGTKHPRDEDGEEEQQPNSAKRSRLHIGAAPFAPLAASGAAPAAVMLATEPAVASKPDTPDTAAAPVTPAEEPATEPAEAAATATEAAEEMQMDEAEVEGAFSNSGDHRDRKITQGATCQQQSCIWTKDVRMSETLGVQNAGDGEYSEEEAEEEMADGDSERLFARFKKPLSSCSHAGSEYLYG